MSQFKFGDLSKDNYVYDTDESSVDSNTAYTPERKEDLNTNMIHPEFDFGYKNFSDKAKAGRLKSLDTYHNNSIGAVIFMSKIGPAIMGRYGNIYFIEMVRYWSHCSKGFSTLRFERFMQYVDAFPAEFIKFYHCTVDENQKIRKMIENYNQLKEREILFYYKDHNDLLIKLKSLSHSVEESMQMQIYNDPLVPRKSNTFRKTFEEKLEFDFCRAVAYEHEFTKFTKYNVGYPGFDYFALYEGRYFAVRDERNHHEKYEDSPILLIQKHYGEFEDALNNLFGEHAYGIFIYHSIDDKLEEGLQNEGRIIIIHEDESAYNLENTIKNLKGYIDEIDE